MELYEAEANRNKHLAMYTIADVSDPGLLITSLLELDDTLIEQAGRIARREGWRYESPC